MKLMEHKVDLSMCRICNRKLDQYKVHTEYFKLLEEDDKLGNLDGFICTDCIIKENGIKKLYHISSKCDIIEKFIPRIPEDRAFKENASTPRISLSSTIEGCLTAVPWGGSLLSDIFWGNKSYLVRVYEFDLDNLDLNNLFPPQYLYSNDLVVDSKVTNEYWYLKPIKPDRSYLIELEDYDERVCDYINYKNLTTGLFKENNGECFNWNDVIEGSFVENYNIRFKIVPEENRSKIFKLNHPIEILGEEKDYNKREIASIIWFIGKRSKTWAAIKEINGKNYLVGELDTTDNKELNTDNIIKFLNHEISSLGVISENIKE